MRTGRVGGMYTNFVLCTLPGDVNYNANKKLSLYGADAVVFVADSDPNRLEENTVEFETMVENLREQGLDPGTIPMVMQWNKRDLEGALPVDTLEAALNKYAAPSFETVAESGEGVLQVFARAAGAVLVKLNREYCSCTFNPDQVRRHEDYVLHTNLATGVTHAVLAGESRPRPALALGEGS